MTEQATGPKPLHPVVKVLAGILVLCTLVALWVTAARIKAAKMAARYGKDETAAADARPSEIRLRRGQSAPVQHLVLAYTAEGLEVRDAKDRVCVRFPAPKTGQLVGWQELRLYVKEGSTDVLLLAPEFVPGAASCGAGAYRDLRAGLRVELTKGRILTLTAWDPVKHEGRVKVEARGQSEERPLTGPQTLLGLRCTLQPDQILIEEAE